MPEEKPRSDADAARGIRKLTLPDGFRVGIRNLDSIIKEVADLKLTDTKAIKAELLKRVRASNYVASSAEKEYLVALFQEYQQKTGAIQNTGKTEVHKHTAG